MEEFLHSIKIFLVKNSPTGYKAFVIGRQQKITPNHHSTFFNVFFKGKKISSVALRVRSSVCHAFCVPHSSS